MEVPYMAQIVQVTKMRFDIFAGYARQPGSVLAHELEYFSIAQERVLGMLFQDTIDRDFSGFIFGKDRISRFRCVDVRPFTDSIDIARADLHVAMQEWATRPDRDFYQGDDTGEQLDVFLPIGPTVSLNPNFVAVSQHESFQAARAVIERMMPFFKDVDGTFVRQFQTEAFDARVWELYLFAAFTELGMAFDRSYEAPDFLCTSLYPDIFVEATTVNPTRINGVIAEVDPTTLSKEELKSYLNDYMPIKWGSALYSKLNKRYWELPHIKNRPILFAIQDFHVSKLYTSTSGTLLPYLYGLSFEALYNAEETLTVLSTPKSSHTWRGKTIPSGFFKLPGSENISAVIMNPLGTISKFNRVGIGGGFGSSRSKTLLTGFYHDHDPNASQPKPFVLRVEEGYSEPWCAGMHIYHNPHALRPVDPAMFGNVAQTWLKDGEVISELPPFHPYNVTAITTVAARLGGQQ